MWRARDGLSQVQELLDAQYDLLLSGKVTDLESTAQALSSLIERIDHGNVEAAALQRAKDSAQRNQRLISNAVRAIKDVGARLQSARTAQRGFESYTPYGMARTVGGARAKLIKKI
ncbi:hypothetical protein M8007_17290 [Dinoroseobacter shibae]|jgi:septation ring formation regulator EzrA|uniref:hypothetical protein n=1 Tax=Dinoroseobacter shibae TaxID=215813 RepID=UPI0005C46E07|nr:hypothetical protein [Dinoroseobacter shibae]URF46510.1 hypothetical protein M8008_17290 [Dinoroseobacter shibae]URF50816.1 hypothetical protein M8007_17290 [Dinoroseobacter shibae]